MRRILPVAMLLLVSCSTSVKLTQSQEYFAGRAIGADILLQSRLLKNNEVQEYVNLVGLTVAYASERPELFNGWTFGVVESDMINAMAAPSGFIFITTAMMKSLQNEDELAGVLAHEIAHVCQRHPELRLQRELDAEYGKKAFAEAVSFAGGVAGSLKGGKYASQAAYGTTGLNFVGKVYADKIWKEGYDRKLEYEADRLGVSYLIQPDCGYNPMAYTDALKRMAVGKTALGGFFSKNTHPHPMDRVNYVLDYLKNKGYTGTTDPARTARFKKVTASIK